MCPASIAPTEREAAAAERDPALRQHPRKGQPEGGSMRSRTGLVAAVLGVLLLALAPIAGAKHPPGGGGGNSGAAHMCQHGGYRSLVGADGTTFRNTGKCVSYAAHGGTFATGIVIPAGKVATLSNANWNLLPCDA